MKVGKKTKLMIVLIFFLICLGLIIPIWSQSSTLTAEYTPIDDAHVNSAAADTNYGSESKLQMYYSFGSGQKVRAYIKFDLTDIQLPVERIVSAKLKLYLTDELSSPYTVKVYPTSSSWEEETLTWNNAPGYDSSKLQDSKEVQSVGFYEFNVTSAIADCIGGYCSFLVGVEGSWTKFASKEYNVAEYWPRLIIEYEPYTETTTQTITETVTETVTDTMTTTVTETYYNDTITTTTTTYQTMTNIITETATTTITQTEWANQTVTATITMTPTVTLGNQTINYYTDLANQLVPLVMVIGVICTMLSLLLSATKGR